MMMVLRQEQSSFHMPGACLSKRLVQPCPGHMLFNEFLFLKKQFLSGRITSLVSIPS